MALRMSDIIYMKMLSRTSSTHNKKKRDKMLNAQEKLQLIEKSKKQLHDFKMQQREVIVTGNKLSNDNQSRGMKNNSDLDTEITQQFGDLKADIKEQITKYDKLSTREINDVLADVILDILDEYKVSTLGKEML